MPIVHLPDRAVIEVAGEEAQHFLQNILTSDVDSLQPDEAWPGALLSPQGKILFDFLISKAAADSTFHLDVHSNVADDFMRRLMLYRLRAKVQIGKQDQLLVGAGWEIESTPSQSDSTWLADRRFPEGAGVMRLHGARIPSDATVAEWDALRVAHGVAESAADYAPGDAFPHDVLLDQNGGVAFRKGCYVGQEVVSRMQHRGTARRRVLIASASQPLPDSGTEISIDGRPAGTLGTVAGRYGLAVVRIDRIKEALDAGTPILAGSVALNFAIPTWAKFTFPESAAPAAEG